MAGIGSRRSLIGLAAFLGVTFVGMLIGGLATSLGIGDWYQTLPKPFWTPPSWVFSPVWTALYVMMAVAAWLVWRNAGGRVANARLALTLFFVQLAVNVLWSVLFFGLRQVGWAAVDNLLLLLLVLATARAFLPHSRAAALLMLPYAVWVGYAASLTVAIWLMLPSDAPVPAG